MGGGFAIATGAAFASKLSGEGRIAVSFFGDGASNQGVFMESLNLGTLWQLPLIMVCEHNRYSEFTPAADVTSGEIADRARAFKMPTLVIDGNDVTAVWQAAGEAVERARSGGGPTFIEAHTYRIQGHLEAEDLFLGGYKYREKSEIDAWRKKDPIDRTHQQLLASGVAAEELAKIGARVAQRVEQAVEFAQQSEEADADLPLQLMFVGQSA